VFQSYKHIKNTGSIDAIGSGGNTNSLKSLIMNSCSYQAADVQEIGLFAAPEFQSLDSECSAATTPSRDLPTEVKTERQQTLHLERMIKIITAKLKAMFTS
jgi:hypothetical protein